MSKMDTLTDKQRAIYEFVKEKIVVRGYGPTVRDIGEEFNILSPNGVMCHLKALERKGLITRDRKKSRAIELTEGIHRHALPLKGRIAAGTPFQAVEEDESIDFAPMFESPGHFCLQVTGDSMIEAQIASGDFVVVRSQKTCRDGEIVAAQVDGDEFTLKRFYREPDRIRLEPANSSMRPIYARNVEIMGVLVGVIRRYGS